MLTGKRQSPGWWLIMYKKASGKWGKHFDFFVLDLVMLTAAYTLACLIRYSFHVPQYWMPLLVRSGIALLVIYFVTAVITQTYKSILQRNKWVELGKVLLQVVAAHIFFVLYLYIIKENDFSRTIYILSAVFSLLLAWCERVFWKWVIRNNLAKNNNLPQLLIIVDGEKIQDYVRSVKTKQYNYFRVHGTVIMDRDAKGEVIPAYTLPNGMIVDETPVVCNREELKKYLLGGVVDEVFLHVNDAAMSREVIDYCLELGIVVHICVAEDGLNYPNAIIEEIGDNVVITTSNKMTPSWKLMIKRAADIAGGLLGCLVMIVLYIIIAPKIKKADPGPVFFTQERIGKNGRHFKFYKFRSMYMNAEEQKADLMQQNEMKGKIFKMKNDPRILPGIGRKIRETSIDEWPQFINVLKGDMSLVGTRPPTVEEYEEYEPHHKARLSFKPGITGLWQVSGRSRITDFERIVELDDQYIRTWSLKSDVSILLKTILVVFKKEGAG